LILKGGCFGIVIISESRNSPDQGIVFQHFFSTLCYKYFNLRRTLFSSLITIVFCFPLFPVEMKAQLYFKGRTVNAEDGLSDDRVTCFYKDKTGYLWIGTRNGLNRYDGSRFKIFRPGKSNSIASEVIQGITGDKEGKIWVATPSGICIYDPEADSWELIQTPLKKNKNSLPNNMVWDIWFDANGLLWIAVDVFEFVSYDPLKKSYTYYNWPAFARTSPELAGAGNYNSIQRFKAKDDHTFYLGTSKGLVELDTRTGQFRFLGGGYNADVHAIHYDKERGLVYVSVQSGRLFCYRENDNQFSEVQIEPLSYPSRQLIIPDTAEIWLPAETGLLRIFPGAAKAICEMGKLPLDGTLPEGGVNRVFIDDSGIRWVATVNGIFLFDFRILNAAFLPLEEVSPRQGINKMTGLLYEADQDQYFVCLREPATVFLVNRKKKGIQKFTKSADGQLLGPCNRIRKDGAGDIWLMTDLHIYRFDREKEEFILFPSPYKGEWVGYKDMARDSRGNYWFASFRFGLLFYDIRLKAYTEVPGFNQPYRRRVATVLFSDTIHNDLWIGTSGHDLHRYSLKDQKLYSYGENSGLSELSSLNMINDIRADAEGRIWVATHAGGVFRYLGESKTGAAFTRYSMQEGLPANAVLSLQPVKNGIWFLTGSAISFMSFRDQSEKITTTGQFFSFSSYDSEVGIPHTLTTGSGEEELNTAVSGGLLFYYPQAAYTGPGFPLFVNQILINGKEQNIQPSDMLKLPSGIRSLKLFFAALYYGGRDQLQFQYRLEGYDSSWINGSDRMLAEYQNLPPGNYRFSLRVLNKESKQLTAPAILKIRVQPRFWQTMYFIIPVILLTGYIIFRIIRSLQQKVKEQEQLNAFATSLYGLAGADDIFWVTTRNCIDILGFEDCVMYQIDEERNCLVQKAAAGPKNPGSGRDVLNPIEIPIGKGIVGAVAATGIAEKIRDTRRDSRYIVDDESRLSEITVPVKIEGKVYAIIDAEHGSRNFFRKRHLRMLEKIAAICAERISKYLTEEKLRAKIARDLHDEMGSTLTSINILSKVGMETGEAGSTVSGYLEKIKDNSAKMMESMSDIVWAINPVNDNLEQLLIRMKEFAAEMLEPARIQYYFETDGELEKSFLNPEQRKDVYLVYKEAVTNAVKYSAATEMTICLMYRQDSLLLQVIDNGKGFDASLEFSGNGLKNMQSRAAGIKAVLSIQSIPGTGTVISLKKNIT